MVAKKTMLTLTSVFIESQSSLMLPFKCAERRPSRRQVLQLVRRHFVVNVPQSTARQFRRMLGVNNVLTLDEAAGVLARCDVLQ
jgi:hypothetical protein